jgi:hypothetical protein
MNDQDHSLSLSDPDRSLVLSHFLTNFLKNLASCHTTLTLKKKEDSLKLFMKEIKDAAEEREFNRMQRHNESLKAKREANKCFSDKMDALISLFKKDNK